MFENSIEMLEQMFMEELDNIDKMSISEIIKKIKKVNVFCLSNIKQLELIYFAYYDLYFTQLKKLNSNITDVDMIKIKSNIAKIREFNTYAKLVQILVEKNPFTTIETENDEPSKKRQKVEIVNENPKNDKNIYESEWVNWIMKNTGFVDKFEPSHFVFCLNNLERFT
jgi:hypothetical protein